MSKSTTKQITQIITIEGFFSLIYLDFEILHIQKKSDKEAVLKLLYILAKYTPLNPENLKSLNYIDLEKIIDCYSGLDVAFNCGVINLLTDCIELKGLNPTKKEKQFVKQMYKRVKKIKNIKDLDFSHEERTQAVNLKRKLIKLQIPSIDMLKQKIAVLLSFELSIKDEALIISYEDVIDALRQEDAVIAAEFFEQLSYVEFKDYMTDNVLPFILAKEYDQHDS